MESKRLGYLLLGVALGCGGTTARTSSSAESSTVAGALSIATFPTAPTTVQAVDETGASIQGPVDEAGRFSLALPKGHVYRFSVALASTSEPVVFPRAANRLDMTVRISAGSASIDLGSIRHFDAAPASGFKVRSGNTAASPSEHADDDDGDGECVDGKDANSGAVCVDDDDKHGCEGAHEDHGGDGECENGKDAKTGAACNDEDDGEETADPSKPMAVPEHNAPDDVAGCHDDGEKEDGEEEDDG